MNEKRIQQVLDIEQQAQGIYQAAVNEAKQLPVQAEQEAQVMLERARVEAEQEAQQMLAKAQSGDESAQILSQAEEKIRSTDAKAQSNFNRAVADVLYRVVGKE